MEARRAGPSRQACSVATSFRPSCCTICFTSLCVILAVARPAKANFQDDEAWQDGSVELIRRSASDQSSSSTRLSIKHNIPLQLVVIVGSVVLAATLIASLAWIFRANNRKNGNGGGLLGRNGKRKNSFDPLKPGSVYEFGDANSIDGLSLKEKSDVSLDRFGRKGASKPGGGFAGGLSPVSPMPALSDSRTAFMGPPADLAAPSSNAVSAPVVAVPSPVKRGRGWQLFDSAPNGKVSGGGHGDVDVEASGGLPPARRPSFIDRLIAHRALPNTNMAKIAPSNTVRTEPSFGSPRPPLGLGSTLVDTGAGGWAPERSFTTPAILLGGGPMHASNTPGMPGSALLSAIGGAFRRVSQHHQHYTAQARRKFVPSPRQLPIESDYEGTIGANDADLPMAKRTNGRQLILCGDSTHSPSVLNASLKTPDMLANAAQSNVRTLARSPLAGDASVHPPLSAKLGTPYQTPGLAGVGTSWPRRMSESAVPLADSATNGAARITLSDQKRMQDFQHGQQQMLSGLAGVGSGGGRKGKLHDWISESQFAAVPPPEVVSRRGSDISFVISERSMPSVSRQNSVTLPRPRQIRTRPSTLRKQQSQSDLQRVPSLNPRFAATTTLASWLGAPMTDKGPIPASPKAVHRSLTRTTQDAKESILEEYFDGNRDVHVDDEAALKALLASPMTDYDQSKGAMLWEDVDSSRPPSYRTAAADGQTTLSARRINDSVKVRKANRATRPTGINGSAGVWSAEDERMEEEKRKVEKAMRRRMRQARRAAKRAAKEATSHELNKLVVQLPAVQAVLLENGYTTTNTSDSSKAKEHAERQRVLTDDGPSLCDVKAWEEPRRANEREREQVPPADMWVEDLLMHTPQMREGAFEDAISMATKARKLSKHGKRRPKQGHKVDVERRTGGGRKASMKNQRRAPHGVRHLHVRLPLPRILSPPESPLTSASEQPSTPLGHRRASVPVSSLHGARSFLVESRRGSKESEPTTKAIQKPIASTHATLSGRHVSMPLSSTVADEQFTARRQLPMPPTGQAHQMSAYEQVAHRVM